MIRFERLAGPDTPVPVFDNGTFECRVGRAGQGYPDFAIPQIVAEGPPNATYIGDAYIGAVKRRVPITSTRNPIRRGAVADWDAMEAVWRFALEEKLGVQANQTPAVLVLDSLQQGAHDREVTAEIMFENLGVGGLRCELQTAAALYESQRPTAVVLDVGYGGSRVYATQDGLPLRISDTVNLGGQDVDDWIGRQFGELGLSSLIARQCARFDLLTQLKSDCCVVTYDRAPLGEKPYQMMNGLSIMLGASLQAAPDILFDPRIAGLNKRSVVDLLMDAINKVESDAVRELLLQNIVVTGGVSCTPGFCERLALECQKRVAHGGPQVGIHAAGGTHQLAVPWMGGSIVANSPACVGVSKLGYEEYGSRIVRESFDWTSTEMACSDLRSRREAREQDHYRENPMPGPDNRQDLRQVFSDSTRDPRPSDLQLLSRVETVATTPRGTEGFLSTKVSTHATRNCQDVNVTGRTLTAQGPQSGTLHQEGIDNLYQQEHATREMLDSATRLVGERQGVHHTNPVPRLPVDDAATTLIVAEERSRLNSERLFSPSAATLSPRGTARIANNEGVSSGMPLARYLSAEIEKAAAPRYPKPPLDPRLYKQQEAEARVPRLPLSKLWTQGPAPQEPTITASSPIPAPHKPGEPALTTHDNWQDKRIAQMQARVTGLSPRGPLDQLCDPLPHERRAFIPRSPCLSQVVEEERSRKVALRSGVAPEREFARAGGHSVAEQTSHARPDPVDGSVIHERRAPPPPPPPAPEPAPTIPEARDRRSRSRSPGAQHNGRLYENFIERHPTQVEPISDNIKPQHLACMSTDRRTNPGDHQRFMASEMRRVEKIISEIDEADYEVHMAIENERVRKGLSIPRPERTPRTDAAPVPAPAPTAEPVHMIPVAKPQIDDGAAERRARQEAEAAARQQAQAQLEQSRSASKAPREDSAARAAKRRAEAEEVRQRVERDREARSAEARQLKQQHSAQANAEARRGIARTNQGIAHTTTSATVQTPAGESTHSPDDWASSRGSLAKSPVAEREQQTQYDEDFIAQRALNERRAEEELAAQFAAQAAADQAALDQALRERQAEQDLAAQMAAAESARQERVAAEQAAADKAEKLARQQAEFEAEKAREEQERARRQEAVRAEKQRQKEAAAREQQAQEEARRARAAAQARQREADARELEAEKAARAQKLAQDQNEVRMSRVSNDPLKRSEEAVDRAMGARPARTARDRSRRGRRALSPEEEAAKKARRDAQNAELEREQEARAQGPSQYSVASTSSGAARDMSAEQARARVAQATAGLDADDLEDFEALMAAEQAKLS